MRYFSSCFCFLLLLFLLMMMLLLLLIAETYLQSLVQIRSVIDRIFYFAVVVAVVIVFVVIVVVVNVVVIVVVDQRNLPLKFGQNLFSNSWYIADIEFFLVGWGGVQSHFRVKPKYCYVRLSLSYVGEIFPDLNTNGCYQL